MDIEALSALPETERLKAKLRLHSACFVSPAMPLLMAELLVDDDWQDKLHQHLSTDSTEQDEGAGKKSREGEGYVVFTRPSMQVERALLSPAGAEFLVNIESGDDLQTALDKLLQTRQDEDFQLLLVSLLTQGCFASFAEQGDNHA